MFILVNIKDQIGYYSKTLAGLKDVTGATPQTMRNWLNNPDIALKKGFIIVPGERKTCNKRANNINKQ